jgi:DNA-binding transcriptional regulator PaaX
MGIFVLNNRQQKPPTLVHEIWSFLRLVRYYHHFIQNFSKIAKPITESLKKENKFIWIEECEETFHTLKNLLTITLVLAQLDINKTFDVYCDASAIGFVVC